MSEDGVFAAAVGAIEATGRKLMDGHDVGPEAMKTYQGSMGYLLAACAKGMWSPAKLNEAIDARIAEHLKQCRQRGGIQSIDVNLVIRCVSYVLIAFILLIGLVYTLNGQPIPIKGAL